MKNYLSIDIGGTEIKCARLDRAGNILEKWKVATPHEKKPFLEAIDQIIKKHCVENIKGIAFCAPGKIEKTQIHFGGSLPFLEGVDFAKIYQSLNKPIAVINDGKAAALAEEWLGNLKDIKNCAAIILGTAVGGGLIVNGQLINGMHYQAGELSFMQLNSHEEHDEGFKGFVGADLSAVGMVNYINKTLHNADLNNGFKAFAAIKSGNAAAIAIFKEYCEQLALLIMNLQAVIDVQRIAIGGGISAQPILVEQINSSYDNLVDSSPLYRKTLQKPEIVNTKFQNDANIYGALYNLLLHVNGEKL